MDKLKSLLDRTEMTDMVFKTYRQKGSKRAHNVFAPPTMETYTIWIRYLLKTGQIDEAVHVAERLRTRLRYEDGTDEMTDAVLGRLKEAIEKKEAEETTQSKSNYYLVSASSLIILLLPLVFL